MFGFKRLSDSYKVCVRHILPDDTFYSYRAVIDIRAEKMAPDAYRFILLGRRDVMINESPPENIADMIRLEIGDSLYPVYRLCCNGSQEGLFVFYGYTVY